MTVTTSDRGGGVLQIAIDDESSRNALTVETLAGLRTALERVRHDDAVHVAVLSGTGSVFCSGGDTRRMGASRPSPWQRRTMLADGVGELARLFTAIDKPVIAAVNGPAVGAGMDLALWCDIRLAHSGAYLKAGFIDVSVVPGFGGAWHLTRMLGPSRALEILLTGDPIAADTALALGLYRSVVDSVEELDRCAMQLASRLAGKPQPAVRLTKRLVQRAGQLDAMDSLDVAWSHFGVLQETPEHAEAIARQAQARADRDAR
jgi:2-(1,2-epoxy-1,2-dihydrophenyl)acetyl-CoA isomerase